MLLKRWLQSFMANSVIVEKYSKLFRCKRFDFLKGVYKPLPIIKAVA